jgi:hypothetical protein
MMIRSAVVVILIGPLLVSPARIAAQAPGTAGQTLVSVSRAIRRDVPLTNSIRAAFDAGTRNMTGRPGPNYWQLEADYTIQARLDPATQTITGTETILVHNNSTGPLNQIVLRLDHNMFRATAPRAAASMPAEITDGMVVTRLVVNGETVDVSAAPAGGGRRGGGAPGAGAGARQTSASGLTSTVATISLATPVAARTTATLEMAWHTRLPGGPGRGHRMTQRWEDTLFQPTQWYPRVAKFDDLPIGTGGLRGWDTSVYMGPSEFYNNFGRFDVRIDVPAGWIVSGTGVLQNPAEVLTAAERDRLTHVLESDAVVTISGPDEIGPGQATAAGDRLVWRFVADRVNDFAWATAKKFVWQATRATIPGKGPVPIHMVFQPEHAAQYANAGPVARHALEFYSKLWAPYPFPQLTLQDGPDSGMEYPMVINSNQGAADHETGHQWWPMVVGTNETRYGWMDEGFNQYMNILSGADSRGVAPNLNGPGQTYGRTSGDENEAPMMWSANDAGSMYSFQTYSKAPLMLSMLGGVVGDENVQRAMSDYAKTWSFKHPSPWDYIFFMNTALKQDLGWFWYYWLWTTESVEGSIADVASSGATTTVTVRQDGQMPSPVVLKVGFAATGAAINSRPNAGSGSIAPTIKMIDDHTALMTWPVDVWFNGSRTFKAVLDFGPRPIETIRLDPSCRFPDRDSRDNVWPKPAAGAAGAAPPCTG